MNNLLNSIYWWRGLMSSPFKWFSHYQFFYCLNEGWYRMNQEWFWGKNFQPEKIVLSVDDFDALVERMNAVPKYNENLKKLMSRKSPWDEDT